MAKRNRAVHYHAFIRTVRRERGVDFRTALATYRATKRWTEENLGRKPRGSDVLNHPRITARSVKNAIEVQRAEEKAARIIAKEAEARPPIERAEVEFNFGFTTGTRRRRRARG